MLPAPPTADLSVSVTDGRAAVVPGTADTYTITVTNNGPDTVSSENVFRQQTIGVTGLDNLPERQRRGDVR